ncbi:RNA-binding protein Cwf29 [Saxophila tyrrhenica]|uniref:RNA-binding protein Cwf29 n=1 Tax=Saxophila tyrrhenica TaxID=1690608 RepID=A0AAV9PJF5_9PEZI|nr:RNA-binding protein Cwf29 [Saxophila tyrrhenica]
MNSVRNIARLNETELKNVTPSNASWHTDYRDTAYIHFGGVPFELSEGDVLTIFSQYGNPKHINLARDKDTGKSRGFGWLKYEDQRSTDLAVDNLSGASVLGRTLSVDHARYKLKEGERETVGDDAEEEDATDGEGEGRRKRSKTESE